MGWSSMHLIQRPSAHHQHIPHSRSARAQPVALAAGRRGSSRIHEARDGSTAPRDSVSAQQAMPVRRRRPRRQETGAAERFGEMGIAAALSRPWDYPTACGELVALLRLGYADLPKAAQALVATDVLLAFRLLPDVQTGYALNAANALLQAVEVALPKQKKAQAVSEFKHSVIAHKRRARVQQNSECASWKFASNRALCGHCRSVIWLSNLTCAAPHHCPRNGRDEVKLRPLLPDTVAKYILHDDDLAASSSESDDTDDSDYENGHPRFWTF